MKTVIEMVHEAGMLVATSRDSLAQLERFAALVRADERNECAKVCEELVPDMSRAANDASVWDVATFDCAAAIRARWSNT